MDNKEIEIKIKVDNRRSIIDKILTLGGKKTYESLEQDIYFDNDENFYESGRVLRIRSEKAGTLFTYKEPLEPDSNLLKRTEIQTYVKDGAAISTIVKKLGFQEKYVKEKKVEYYELDGFVVEFHTLPFLGDFLEIEATEERLNNFLPKLGLSLESGIAKGYHKLFAEFCESHNLKDVQFTFDQETEYLQK